MVERLDDPSPADKRDAPPERIYLQHDPANTGEPFHTALDVTWCKDQINNNDIEYVRADLVTRSAGGLTTGDNPNAAAQGPAQPVKDDPSLREQRAPALAAPITQTPGELATFPKEDTLGIGVTGRKDGHLSTRSASERTEIPAELYDGMAVYVALGVEKTRDIRPEMVSDVLDTVVRLIRKGRALNNPADSRVTPK